MHHTINAYAFDKNNCFATSLDFVYYKNDDDGSKGHADSNK